MKLKVEQRNVYIKNIDFNILYETSWVAEGRRPQGNPRKQHDYAKLHGHVSEIRDKNYFINLENYLEKPCEIPEIRYWEIQAKDNDMSMMCIICY